MTNSYSAAAAAGGQSDPPLRILESYKGNFTMAVEAIVEEEFCGGRRPLCEQVVIYSPCCRCLYIPFPTMNCLTWPEAAAASLY